MTLAADIGARRKPPIAVGLVAFLLVFALTVVLLWFGENLPTAISRVAAIVFVLLAGPFLVLAHEGGHYAVARLIGWRVALFTWGGYTIRLKPWRVRHGSPPFADAAGAVVAVPGRESRWGYIAVFAGGPGSNLLIALLSIVAALAVKGQSAAFFWLLAVFSLFLGLSNLLPWRHGSDGSQIVSLFFERDLSARTVMVRLAEQMIQEVRPRDWPPALMQAVMRLTVWTPYPALMLSLYVWRMDRGEIEAARETLDRAGSDPEVFCERAFWAAFVENNAVAAREFLSRYGGDPSSLRYWRTRAALIALEMDRALLDETIRKGRIIADRDPYATVWDREVLDHLEQRSRT